MQDPRLDCQAGGVWLATCVSVLVLHPETRNGRTRHTLMTMGVFKRPSAATPGTSRLRFPEPGLVEAGPGRLWRLCARGRPNSASEAGAIRPAVDDAGLADALLEGLLDGLVSNRFSNRLSSLLPGRDMPLGPAMEEDMPR